MIAWNAFMNYFVMTGEKVKITVAIILSLALVLRRKETVHRIYERLMKIPIPYGIVGIALIAFLLRLGWVLWSPHTAPSAGTEDTIMLRHARDLAAGNGYRTAEGGFSADRPIGYPLLLALLFRFMGENIGLVEILHVLLGVLSVLLVFMITLQISNRLTAYLAALLLAFYPTSIFASKIILEEHVFIPFWLVGMSLMIADLQKPHWGKIAAAGFLFGIAAHFRTYAFAMGLVVFLLWLVGRRRFWSGFFRALVIQVLILLWAVPWAVRNYHKLGEPILYTTWIGPALYFANNDMSDVRYPINPTIEQGGDEDFSRAATEVGRNRAGKKAAFRWIVLHPWTFVQKAVGRIIFMLGITREGWVVKDNFYTIRSGRERPKESMIRRLDKLDNDYYGTVFLLAVMGVVFLGVSRKETLKQKGVWCVLLTLAYYLSFVALTPGQRKYRFVIEPIFCMLAAHSLSFIYFFGTHDAEKIKAGGA